MWERPSGIRQKLENRRDPNWDFRIRNSTSVNESLIEVRRLGDEWSRSIDWGTKASQHQHLPSPLEYLLDMDVTSSLFSCHSLFSPFLAFLSCCSLIPLSIVIRFDTNRQRADGLVETSLAASVPVLNLTNLPVAGHGGNNHRLLLPLFPFSTEFLVKTDKITSVNCNRPPTS